MILHGGWWSEAISKLEYIQRWPSDIFIMILKDDFCLFINPLTIFLRLLLPPALKIVVIKNLLIWWPWYVDILRLLNSVTSSWIKIIVRLFYLFGLLTLDPNFYDCSLPLIWPSDLSDWFDINVLLTSLATAQSGVLLLVWLLHGCSYILSFVHLIGVLFYFL